MEAERQYEGLLRWPDILRLGKLLTGGLVAALTPYRFDQAAADTLLRLHPATRSGSTAELSALMAKTLAHRRSGDWQALADEHARMTIEESWGRFRGMGPGRWRPTIEFSGEPHVRNALKAGRGAVFWCMRFSSGTVLKQGFHQIGLPLVHLSLAEHGAWGSRTTLGTSVISPLFSRAENPHLADRVIIPLGGSLGYLQTLRDHLRRNACVSIFAGLSQTNERLRSRTGRQLVEVPFLTGNCGFATGAPSLAWVENSALLPAYTIRTGRFQYRVVVDEPIPIDRSIPRKEFLRRAVGEFAGRMERLVERYPADWQDWDEWKRSQD